MPPERFVAEAVTRAASDFRARTPDEVANYPIAAWMAERCICGGVAEVMNTPREQCRMKH